jgi:hypothetical protein
MTVAEHANRPRHAPVRAGFDSPIAIPTLDFSSQLRGDGSNSIFGVDAKID